MAPPRSALESIMPKKRVKTTIDKEPSLAGLRLDLKQAQATADAASSVAEAAKKEMKAARKHYRALRKTAKKCRKAVKALKREIDALAISVGKASRTAKMSVESQPRRGRSSAKKKTSVVSPSKVEGTKVEKSGTAAGSRVSSGETEGKLVVST